MHTTLIQFIGSDIVVYSR